MININNTNGRPAILNASHVVQYTHFTLNNDFIGVRPALFLSTDSRSFIFSINESNENLKVISQKVAARKQRLKRAAGRPGCRKRWSDSEGID
jgi:hypothetical protein